MSPSPWRRRRKPRHARPRPPRRYRWCPLCVIDALEAAVGPAGQLLLSHQTEHWITAGSACLVLLRMAGQRCPHAPDAHDRPTPGTDRHDGSGAGEAHDVS